MLVFCFSRALLSFLSMMSSTKWSGRSTTVAVAGKWQLDIDCDLLKVGGRGPVEHIGYKV